jgi:hypothetical protein
LVGRVRKRQRPKIGLSRLRTNGCEFRANDLDDVVAAGILIFERFEQIARILERRHASILIEERAGE